MGETRFRLIFKGEVSSDQDPAEVRKRLVTLFKTNPAQIEQLFCGKTVVVKKEIDGATAEKYRRAFECCGAVAYVQEMQAPPNTARPSIQTASPPKVVSFPTPQPRPSAVLERKTVTTTPPPPAKSSAVPTQSQPSVTAAVSLVTCPKCGHKQEGDGECARCGVIISKFQEREQQRREIHAKSTEILNTIQEHIPLLEHDFVHIAPDIPADKLAAATSSIAKLRSDERPLLLIDSTVTGNARNGLLITSEYLYGRDMGFKAREIALGEIKTAQFKTGPLNTLIINDDDFVSLPTKVDMEDLAAMLLELAALRHTSEAVEAGEPAIERPEVVNRYIAEIKEMLDEGAWDSARDNLEALLHNHSDDWEIRILLARAYFRDGKKKSDPKAAFKHLRRAIELGAPARQGIAEAAASILAANKAAEEGVVWLERAFDTLRSSKEREKFEKKIAEFRTENKLGENWQFFGARDELMLETDDIEEIRDKLVSGELPADAKCRRNRVGKPEPVSESLAGRESRIELLYRPIRYHVKNFGMVFGVIFSIITIIAMIVAVFVGAGDAFTDFFKEVGIDWDGMSIWAKLAFVALLVLTAFMAFTLNLPGLIVLYIVGGAVAAALTQGKFSFQELGGFMLAMVIGFPIFIIVSILALGIVAVVGFVFGYVIGAPIGWLVGVIRLPSLPKLPKTARA
jgi:hypothetical protein